MPCCDALPAALSPGVHRCPRGVEPRPGIPTCPGCQHYTPSRCSIAAVGSWAIALLFPSQTRTPDLDSVLTIFSVRMVAGAGYTNDALMRLSAVAFKLTKGSSSRILSSRSCRSIAPSSPDHRHDNQGVIGLHLGNDLWSGLGGGYELNALIAGRGNPAPTPTVTPIPSGEDRHAGAG